LASGDARPARLADAASRLSGGLYGEAIRDEMAKFGWVEGRNLRSDIVYAGRDVDRLRAGAAKLVNLGPDVIVTGSVPATIAVQQQNPTGYRQCTLTGRMSWKAA
jgi:hypothetical protein